MTSAAERRARGAASFHRFGRVEAPDLASPMYAELAYGVALDDDLLDIAAFAQPHQPQPNMLFAAVQYLLLRGTAHPLATHYPIMSGADRPPGPAFPLFRDFCLAHREQVVALLRHHRTQTNVVRRCTCLLPAFAVVYRQALSPLALIDIGASAGLNLAFDRYGYRYLRGGHEALRWGADDAAVVLQADLVGGRELPALPDTIPVAGRDGIDLAPVDLDDPAQMLWLRALIWPEHEERHRQLEDAAAEMARCPVRLHRGDAADVLPRLLASVPEDHAVVAYSTAALYQFPRRSRQRVVDALARASRERPIWQVALEGLQPHLRLTVARFRDGIACIRLLARASPHGWWIEWTEVDSI